jgi:glycosyltransferase involved in cell wall biosynthesis
MRILVLTNLYPAPERPAYGTFIQSQVESLKSESISADVLVVEGWRSPFEYLKAIGRLRRRIHKEKYDLVHAHYGFSAWIALAQRRLPIVTSFLGDDLLGTRKRDGSLTVSSRLYAWINRRIASRCAAVVVKSEEMRTALDARDGKRRPPIHVVPNGVDLDLFRPLGREACLQQLGLEFGPLRILFVGNPEIPGKRHSLAQRAVELLNRKRDALLHTVWGRPQDEVVLWMNACDALLVTSWSEGSPNVVKEAMACNLPVVSVEVGDVGSLLSRCAGNEILSGHAALEDPVKSPAARAKGGVEGMDARLAGALDRVAGTGRTRCRDAMGDLSLGAVAGRLKEIYEEVLARGAS